MPTTFEARAQEIEVDDSTIELALWDTSATGELSERLRPLLYPNSHVIVICYAVDRPETLQNVTDKVRTLSLLLPQASL